MTDLLADGTPFTRAHAVLSRKNLDLALRAGTVRRLLRGVYVDARVKDCRELRVAAVDLVRPADGVACSETAAWIMGLDLHPPGRRHDFIPTFVVPHGTTRLTGSGVDCRQAKLSPHDTTVDFGVPSTTALRTASDLLLSTALEN